MAFSMADTQTHTYEQSKETCMKRKMQTPCWDLNSGNIAANLRRFIVISFVQEML